MQVFGKEWFEHHQNELLRFANTRFGRKVLRIDGDVHPAKSIVQIMPDSYTVLEDIQKDRVVLITDFRTRDKFARRLFHAFKPLWYGMHYADLALPRRLEAALGFGFSTLTVYPSGYPGTSVDGWVGQFYTPPSAGLSFPVIRAAAGSEWSVGNQYAPCAAIWCSLAANTYYRLYRGIFLFNTAALGVVAQVSAGTFSLYGYSKGDYIPLTGGQAGLAVVSSDPSSSAILAASDYGALGSTRLSSDLAYASFSTAGYNDLALNAAGIAAISKTGLTKFGTRFAADVDGTAAWLDYGTAELQVYYANEAGTDKDPKLVVTYSYPLGVNVSATWKGIMIPSVNVTGTWKAITGCWVKVSGAWKKVF